ncbi:MAG: DNA integrity scanning protein DisA nucleotide-binding domain protein, partial [Clostridia bacterium]
SGTSIDAKLSSELLETIFFPKSPLHDGAVVINGDRVVSAGCYLPLTSKLDLSKELGTRHRAAIGISESNPTLTAIVVSEETGIISAMHDGKMKRYLSNDDLKQVLEVAFYLTDLEAERELWGGRAE